MENGLSRSEAKVLKAREVSVGADAVEIPVGGPARLRPPRPAPDDDPEINLERASDGTILSIEVRCPCGRVTTLRCEYLDEEGANNELPTD
ncbi:MAG: hypothetical protein R6X33_02930 [Candidatus Brocadiia bacterium]